MTMTPVIPQPKGWPYRRSVRVVYLVSVSLHILAAMTWIGGMVAFIAAVMPYFRGRPAAEKAAFLSWFGPRFRVVSWCCFAVLIVSGTFNLWARGVRPNDFLRGEWHATAFGHLVVIKLTLVALAIAFTAAHERFTSPTVARWMGRSLLLIGMAVVVAAVMLVRAL